MRFEKFWNALIFAIRQDTTLVALTHDTNTERHIAKSNPSGQGRYPFIGVELDDDTAAVPNSYTGYKRSVVCFNCISVGQDNSIEAIKIADRLDVLLHRDGEPAYKQYWNISNNDILNHWTRWMRRSKEEYDDKIKTWTIRVHAVFKWHMKIAQTV